MPIILAEAIEEGALYVATAYYGATVVNRAVNKLLNLSPTSSYRLDNKMLAPSKVEIAHMKARLESKGKTHGYKLDDKSAEGYSLRDRKTGEVKKYGETTIGEDKYGEGNQKRYSKKELKEKDVDYVKEESGTKKGNASIPACKDQETQGRK